MRHEAPPIGNRTKRPQDWRAASLVEELLADHGWTPADLERVSRSAGHPDRSVSRRTVYRIIETGHKPGHPIQFEIAACFGLLPSHIWGRLPLPADYHPQPARWSEATTAVLVV